MIAYVSQDTCQVELIPSSLITEKSHPPINFQEPLQLLENSLEYCQNVYQASQVVAEHVQQVIE